MAKSLRLLIAVVLVAAALPVTQTVTTASPDDLCLASGGQHLEIAGTTNCYWLPAGWKGDVLVFAHGYVNPYLPVDIPWDQLSIGGTFLPQLVNSLGYAFATTSYHKNGLAVKEGVQDMVDLVAAFRDKFPNTRRVFIGGASEGGLVTTLALEKYPQVFSGGLETCGPIGNFNGQINYWGDFRVVFDYFFPELLVPYGGSAVDIPNQLLIDWAVPPGSGGIQDNVVALLAARQDLTAQLLAVSKAPIDPADPAKTMAETVLGLLWYNVDATNEGQFELGGQPFDNSRRRYFGSLDDVALNMGVQRFSADPSTLTEIAAYYTTSGALKKPLVAMHTTGDPIVPYWHVPLYRAKTLASRSALKFTAIPIARYGHCNFKPAEVVFAFGVMVLRSTLRPLTAAAVRNALPDVNDQADFQALSKQLSTFQQP